MARALKWAVGCTWAALHVGGCSLITHEVTTFGASDGGIEADGGGQNSTDGGSINDAAARMDAAMDATTAMDAAMTDAGSEEVDAGPCGVCGGSTPYCDLMMESCVECLGNSDCDDGDPCTSDVCTISGTCSASPIPSCIVAVHAGQGYTCARRHNGEVECWGNNGAGQLGIASNDPQRERPARVVDGSWAQISTGNTHTCGRTSGGGVTCWGHNHKGQLGNGTTDPTIRPGLMAVLGVNAIDIAADGQHTCAVRSDGTMRCWGSNTGGQLGNGENTEDPTPRPVYVNTLTDATQVALGSNHSCALRASGQVSCWGINSQRQVGTGSTASYIRSPATLPDITDAVQVSAGNGSACALLSTGTVKCWGSNQYGQVGDGSGVLRAETPVEVAGLTNAVQISVGEYFACAVRTGGQVVCWGRNNNGQLGDGTDSDRPTPVAVPGLTALDVSAGGNHACARRTGTGEVVCWGSNYYGQIGNGTTDPAWEPTPVIF